MKRLLSLTLSLLPFMAFAQYSSESGPTNPIVGEFNQILLDNLCNRDFNFSVAKKYSLRLEKLNNEDVIFVDQGFCRQFNDLNQDNHQSINLNLPQVKKNKNDLSVDINSGRFKDKSSKWKINFYASHSFTKYMPSDLKINSSRYQVVIKDYEWAERSSRNFFEPKTWKEKGNNPAQFIDEPTNEFMLSLEKDGHEFFLSAFHPKFVQASDQIKEINGTIDGQAINGMNPVNGISWDPVNNVPGVRRIVNQHLTHLQMQIEAGYGHRFTIFKSRIGQIVYVPTVGVGVMIGEASSVIAKNSEWIDYEEVVDKYGVNGYGFTLGNRVELRSANGKFGIFYDNKLSFYKMEHAFQDGVEKYNLNFRRQQIGLSFVLLSKKRR